MRILVTGSSGFLGFNLLKLFEKEQKKHKLFALYNKNKPIGLIIYLMYMEIYQIQVSQLISINLTYYIQI